MEINVTKPNEVHKLRGFGGEVFGDKYAVTDTYLTKNGKPFIFKMGEIHYSRTNEDEWEEEIIKMREGGIDIIASYVFWIHHEETEGEFLFEGNRNIGKFFGICRKLSMPFVLRIGPWAHGEARNGGFPDWLIEKTNAQRTLSEPYMSYVRRFFERLYPEVKDYSDVILGIQIENELSGEVEYARELKRMLVEIGYSAPLWTFTGWGGADKPESCPYGEVLCLYGAYPEAPWLNHVRVHTGCTSFFFSSEREDANIGIDIFKNKNVKLTENKNTNTPFLTCEMGGGNQITYHRRPLISKEDILAIVTCKLGSGSNGVGYYVYHGGKNPIGKTTMQESRATGYSNDLPIVSYDFEAPIGEAGQIRDSYYYMKPLHDFIAFEGSNLAKMPAYFPAIFPDSCTDTKTLRASVRSDGERGYIFVCNHFHAGEMEKMREELTVNLPDGEKISLDIDLDPHAVGVIPFNYQIGSEKITYMTALPVSADGDKLTLYVQPGIAPVMCIDGSIREITDEMIVGGKIIKLTAWTPKAKSKGEIVELTSIGESDDDTFFSHIINYDGTVPTFGKVSEYKFTLPENAKYLNINAKGNIGALFLDGKLYSDFYLCGDIWTVNVKSLPEKSELVLKILPLNESDKEKVYFEYDMPTGVVVPEVYALSDETIYV